MTLLINHMLLAYNRAQNTEGKPKGGLISSVNAGMVKVLLQPEDIETGFMPYGCPWASVNAGFYCAPNIGDQVVIVYLEGSKDVPVAISSLFWNNCPAPQDVLSGQAKWYDATGAFIKLTNDGNLTLSPSSNADDFPNARILVPGNLAISEAGKGLQVKEGSNAKSGIATLNAGIVTVTNTSVTANSRILLTRQSVGTATTEIGSLGVVTKTAGVNFIINSYLNNASVATGDNSIVYYNIIEPA